ncbi:MAG TPA: acyl-CoA dehydrogenase family protein [Acidimicrobiia bacterium]|nr:acyl-CoA dehydrogenase family protein [Acidimicrobiia bacterium]
MDSLLELGPGDPASTVRDSVSAWVEGHVPADWLAAARSGDPRKLREVRSREDYEDWYPALAASGLVAPAWPRQFGGLGLPGPLVRVVNEVLAGARLARLNFIGVNLAGPTILEWGTEEQKERYLRPILDNSEIWCQLFSEPSAGSDLAGLATRARRTGGDWIVDGQKVWTSFAHRARFGLLLARTDPAVPKHRGLTYFLADMGAAGVTVRPLREMTGNAVFNEVFLDGVALPDTARLGPVGEGWAVARTTLMNERSALGTGGGFSDGKGGRSVLQLLDAYRAGAGGASPAERAATRHDLVRAWADKRVGEWTAQRAKAARLAGRPLGPEGSVAKLFEAQRNQRLQRLAHSMLGAQGMARDADDNATAEVWHGFLRSRANTIEGGTSEIQRNILGERVLGLPAEPAVDRDIAWQDILSRRT